LFDSALTVRWNRTTFWGDREMEKVAGASNLSDDLDQIHLQTPPSAVFECDLRE